MTVGLYKITNTVNGKYYIGSSNNFSKRWSKHRNTLRRGKQGNAHLQAAFNKYGEEAFVYEVFREFEEGTDASIVLQAEQAILDSFTEEDWNYKVYNISRCVENTYRSEETKRRLSEIQKEKWADPKHREYMEQFFCQKGIRMSDEHRRKQSEGQKGKKFSEERIKRMSENRIGKEVSKDTIRKKSKGKGVYNLASGKYGARISVKRKNISLGSYDTYEEALQVRLDAEQKYWWSSEDGSDVTGGGAA